MKKIYLIDFDGTISIQDTLVTLVKKFYPIKYLRWGQLLIQGTYTIADWLKAFEKHFEIRQELYDEALKKITIDPTFGDFIQNKEVRIVSGGFDYNINFILNNFELTPPKIYSNHLEFIQNAKISIKFPYFNEECGKCGVCKKNIVLKYQKEYNQVIMIGDGITDLCAAKSADLVYAKEGTFLNKKLTRLKIPHTTFKFFSEID